MRSPRFAPAGLLVRMPAGARSTQVNVAIDGGEAADPGPGLAAWLVTDDRAELIAAIRRRARALGVTPHVGRFQRGPLLVAPRRVVHTSHPTYAYEVRWHGRRVVWAPEFWRLPRWVAGADILFADAAGWSRPIGFRGGVGGHAAATDVAERARALGVRRLVFAHIGRPTIAAMERHVRASFGEYGRDGAAFRLTPARTARD